MDTPGHGAPIHLTRHVMVEISREEENKLRLHVSDFRFGA